MRSCAYLCSVLAMLLFVAPGLSGDTSRDYADRFRNEKDGEKRLVLAKAWFESVIEAAQGDANSQADRTRLRSLLLPEHLPAIRAAIVEMQNELLLKYLKKKKGYSELNSIALTCLALTRIQLPEDDTPASHVELAKTVMSVTPNARAKRTKEAIAQRLAAAEKRKKSLVIRMQQMRSRGITPCAERLLHYSGDDPTKVIEYAKEFLDGATAHLKAKEEGIARLVTKASYWALQDAFFGLIKMRTKKPQAFDPRMNKIDVLKIVNEAVLRYPRRYRLDPQGNDLGEQLVTISRSVPSPANMTRLNSLAKELNTYVLEVAGGRDAQLIYIRGSLPEVEKCLILALDEYVQDSQYRPAKRKTEMLKLRHIQLALREVTKRMSLLSSNSTPLPLRPVSDSEYLEIRRFLEAVGKLAAANDSKKLYKHYGLQFSYSSFAEHLRRMRKEYVSFSRLSATERKGWHQARGISFYYAKRPLLKVSPRKTYDLFVIRWKSSQNDVTRFYWQSSRDFEIKAVPDGSVKP